MAEATDYPSESKKFDTTARAFRALEKEGVDPMEFLQRVIDDTNFRDQVIKLVNPVHYWTVNAGYRRSNLQDLLIDCVNAFDRQGVEFDYSSKMKRYMTPSNLQQLFAGLNPRHASILVMHYGLDHSERSSLLEVADYHRIPEARIGKILWEAKLRLADSHKMLLSEQQLV